MITNKKLSVVLSICLFMLLPVSGFTLDQDELEKKVEEQKKLIQFKPDDATLWFSLGLALHDLCSQFNLDYSKDAVDAFNKSYDLEPDPMTKVYLGSAWTLIARDSNNTITKINGVITGTDYMDEAIQTDPTNIYVRRVRYENNYYLPDIFERRSFVEEDINYLIKIYSKSPEVFDNAYDPAHFLYYKAMLLSYDNEWQNARKFALIAKKIVSDEKLAKLIQNFLEGNNL